MNSPRLYSIAAFCTVYVLLGTALWAQVAAPRPHGIPHDWSEHTIAFSLDGLALNPDLINQEPRIQHQLWQRFQQPRSSEALPGTESDTGSLLADQHRDWAFDLVRGHVPTGMFPAKYSFDPSAPPSCTNDFVVFGLNTAGSTGGQANLVGLDNLYAGSGGLCTTGPTAKFAYNATTVAGGKIVTSVVLSLDGSQIAFVESTGTASVFHVLKWTANQGTISNAAAPGAAMSSLPYSGNATTTSSPWIDYSDDAVYLSDDKGIMYKISPVFTGAPALVTTSPWPITVASGTRLTPPVLDRSRGMLLAGARNGDFYEINTTSGAVSALIIGAHGAFNAGIFAPPIVDITNGTAFVISSNNGHGAAVLDQVDTQLFTVLASATIGEGSSGGTTAVDIYQPALSNAYYTSPSSGAIYTCGTGQSDTTPWVYSFGFTGRTMLTPPVSSRQLLTSTANCSPWTEFFNPNIGANGTDFFFFGLTQDCTGTGTSGCVAEITATSNTPTMAPVTTGPSGIVVDNWNTTVGQASSIYLTAEGNATAYKFTQNGLH